MLLAQEPWSGHYDVREALWGYAHYGQFTRIGWRYVDDGYVTTDDNGIEIVETDFHKFLNGLVAMLEQLAHHYEKGATAYGVDNWKKGIPVIGGERGGSFTDSMLRHLNQFLEKRTDENHEIACIWNAIGALYATRYNENVE